MTLPLIQVPDHDIQFNFDEIAKRFLDTGGRALKMRSGTGTISIVANNSGNATVTHGLGSTPSVVVATTDQVNWFASNDSFGASTFRVQVREYQAAVVTVTVTYYWLAIG